MSYIDEHTGLDVVTLAECIRHLESHEIARVAFLSDNVVQLFPVNYLWDGEGLVFRCEESSKMARAAGREFVAEIDGMDRRNRAGWSVIARGIGKRIIPDDQPETVARLDRLALYPWVGGEKSVWIRMIPAPLTGRRAARSAI